MRIHVLSLMTLLGILLASCTSTPSSSSPSQPGIEISSAVVRLAGMAMPGMGVGEDSNLAGYLTIKNTGSTDDSLIGVQVDFATAMLHQTTVDSSGVASMKEINAIPVPAGQTVELKPGSYHIMFMRPTRELKAGESVELILQFQNAGSIKVQANVTNQ
ncbi:MAG TPA: copper chaperone PCu(A)C [Anaerolineales bacterium]|nr:copper chaperone PCu(A)C [Anaerolineales bacterium]